MRDVDATDAPDDLPMLFTVNLNPLSFFIDSGNPGNDGSRATGTVYLAVWMSSGALTLQRLIFWPLGPRFSPQTVLGTTTNCQLESAPRLALPEGRTAICRSMETAPACGMGEERVERASATFADNGLSRVQWAASEVQAIVTMFSIGVLRPVMFGDKSVSSTPEGIPIPCNPMQLAMLYPGGTGSMVCNGFGPGMAYFKAENVTRNGLCAQIPDPLEVPRTAEYERPFIAEQALLDKVMGYEEVPLPMNFTATSQ